MKTFLFSYLSAVAKTNKLGQNAGKVSETIDANNAEEKSMDEELAMRLQQLRKKTDPGVI